jgi:phenylpyruvate tautomerase PptA (4-oxalocrotonate tautomerase family)
MAFLNGSTSTINGVPGAGPALHSTDMMTRLRAFLAANGWAATNVTAISTGQGNIVFQSGAADTPVNIRMQKGTVNNTLAPLNANVASNRLRFTVAGYFDPAGQVVYNEAGNSANDVELPVDDINPFNFWVLTDSLATHVHVVTQIGGSYYALFAGRLQRQVYTEIARSITAVTVATPGTPQSVTITLDRPRPVSWTQGRLLMIQSQAVADATGNGTGVGTQKLPVELGAVGNLTGLPANQLVITLSRNYGVGAILGQDPCPQGVARDLTGVGESIAVTYDNGGGANSLGYTAPNGQLISAGVSEMAPQTITQVLTDQGPDSYQGDQIIAGMYTYSATAGRAFAFRHQVPNIGRVHTLNNPLDELLLPSGDRWLAYTVAGVRIALGKVN